MDRNTDDDTPTTCFVCRKDLSANGKHLCSNCKTVSYCSRKCQSIHWKGGHKHVCRKGYILLGDVRMCDEGVYHKGWGFCLDCLDEQNKKRKFNSSYYCDGCMFPYICAIHESTLGVCKQCRGVGGNI